jgi:bile acid:Na+ symporter, BASS family
MDTGGGFSMDAHLWQTLFVKFIEILVHATFPMVVFVISSKVTFVDLGKEFARPWLLIKAFVVTSILVPLVTAGMVKIFQVPLLVGGIMLIAAVSPGDSFALLEAKGKKGSINLAAATMTVLCLVMPMTVPLWLWTLSGWFPVHLTVKPMDLFSTVAPITVLPLLVGVGLHSLLPKAAEFVARALEWLFRVSLIIVGILGLVMAVYEMPKFTGLSALAVFAAVSLAIIMGYNAGGGNRRDRISLGLTASLGNLAAVMLVAHVSYPGVHVLGAVVVFVLLRWVVIMVWYLFLTVRLRLRGETLY